jgi:hypothetical protein
MHRTTPIGTLFWMIDSKAPHAAHGRVLNQTAAMLGDGDVIDIDGKVLRGARNKRTVCGP